MAYNRRKRSLTIDKYLPINTKNWRDKIGKSCFNSKSERWSW